MRTEAPAAGPDTKPTEPPAAGPKPEKPMATTSRASISSAIAADAKASKAMASLPTAHQHVVLGACASIERAVARNKDAAAVASTQASVSQLAGGDDIWAAIAKAAGI